MHIYYIYSTSYKIYVLANLIFLEHTLNYKRDFTNKQYSCNSSLIYCIAKLLHPNLKIQGLQHSKQSGNLRSRRTKAERKMLSHDLNKDLSRKVGFNSFIETKIYICKQDVMIVLSTKGSASVI